MLIVESRSRYDMLPNKCLMGLKARSSCLHVLTQPLILIFLSLILIIHIPRPLPHLTHLSQPQKKVYSKNHTHGPHIFMINKENLNDCENFFFQEFCGLINKHQENSRIQVRVCKDLIKLGIIPCDMTWIFSLDHESEDLLDAR